MVDVRVGEALEGITDRLDRIEDKLDANNRLRNWALATAVVCLIAAGFSAGYALTSREQLNTAKQQLRQQIETNRRVVCSSARSTALAFREPSISADGTKEPQDHFIDRMLAQRETLRLAGPLDCAELPGFITFPFLRGRALYEIASLLHDSDPKRFPDPKRTRIPPRETGASAPSASETEESSTPASSGGAGSVGEQPVSNPPKQPEGGGGGGAGGGNGGGGGGKGTEPAPEGGQTPEGGQAPSEEPVASGPPAPSEPGGEGSTEPGNGTSNGINLEVPPAIPLPVKPQVCLPPVVGVNCPH